MNGINIGNFDIVLPKRWVIERTLGWINRARRLSKDFEATIEACLAWLQLALAFLHMRRIARKNEVVRISRRAPSQADHSVDYTAAFRDGKTFARLLDRRLSQ
jgi:hypothetical protein